MIRFPDIDRRLGLGVGLDLKWGSPYGFGLHETPDRRVVDRVEDRVARFLTRYEDRFSYAFFSFQAKDRTRLSELSYAPAFDDLFERASPFSTHALHHTMLNLGAMERYERAEILELTNALIRRYGLRWINEDLGVWSLHGQPMPYPLPPYLTEAGLAASIRNVRQTQSALEAPLLIEFPGFSEGTSFYIGKMHAYDFFATLARETDTAVTLDTGHLLSYQWLLGRRGDDLFGELDRLPLEHCFEIHLSGCQITDARFFDVHHGVLLDEQVDLLDRLLPRCPNLKGVTYEDPKFDRDGRLHARAERNFERVASIVGDWAS